jgi:hypothetical protein
MDQPKSRMRDDVRMTSQKLYDAATEIRALAYLLETQGQKANDISETDMDEIGHGMGRMLKRLARSVRRAARSLDDALVG